MRRLCRKKNFFLLPWCDAPIPKSVFITADSDNDDNDDNDNNGNDDDNDNNDADNVGNDCDDLVKRRLKTKKEVLLDRETPK